MNCRKAILEISNFLDGELDTQLRQDLERHFADCEECNLVVVQTKKTIEIFVESEAVELPGDVRLRLHEALRRKLGEI